MPEEQFDTREIQSSENGSSGRNGQPSGNRPRQPGQRPPRRQNVEREFSESGSPRRGPQKSRRKSGRRQPDQRIQGGFRDVQERAGEGGGDQRQPQRGEPRRDRHPGRPVPTENTRRDSARQGSGRAHDRRGAAAVSAAPAESPSAETASADRQGMSAPDAGAGRPVSNDRSDTAGRMGNAGNGRERQRLRVESAERQRKARGRKRIQTAIVEDTYEDLQHENDRLMKEIILEIAGIRTITLD